MAEQTPVVLVVDGDAERADRYARWLDDYEVRRAATGEEALDSLDGAAVVLAERRLPDGDADDVVATLRARGVDVHVALLTDSQPDLDEVREGIDDYLPRSASREELVGTVERLLEREEFEEHVEELRELAAERADMERECSPAELAGSERYAELTEDIEELDDELDEDAEVLADDEAFLGAIRDLTETDDAERGGE